MLTRRLLSVRLYVCVSVGLYVCVTVPEGEAPTGDLLQFCHRRPPWPDQLA